MGQFFREGEQKIRPGVYQRYSQRTAAAAVTLDGVNAFIMRAAWGPAGIVTTHTSTKSLKDTYGQGEGVEAATEIFRAGAKKLHVYRMEGTGGEKGTAMIGGKLTVTAKHPGERAIKVKVQEKPDNAAKKQLLVVEGTAIKETHTVDAGEQEASAFVAKILERSSLVEAELVEEGAVAEMEASLAGGKNPTITAADYLEGFYALEPYAYNVVCTDSADLNVASMMKEYVMEAAETGKQVIGVIGQGSETKFQDRLFNAKDCNSHSMVYLGNGYVDVDQNPVEDVKAIAYTAGIISATPANQSIVHAVVEGAVDTIEKFTNDQYEDAINNGMLLLSTGPDGQVWYDSGVNTLTVPAENQDKGWKKIKRTKARIEMMYRIDRALAPKVGKVNCDPDGIADVLQAANGVLGTMADESKLQEGARMYEDPENPYTVDSAWFVIEAVDIDTLEKIYLHYRFQYSQSV